MKKSYLVLLAIVLACCVETPAGVTFVKLTPPAMITSLEAGTIDGAIIWEPWAALSVQRGLANYKLNSSDIWEGHPCCVVAADREWSSGNEELLTRFVAAHIAAINWINRALEENNSKLYSYAEQLTGLNRSVVESAIKNMEFDYHIKEQAIKEVGEAFNDFELYDAQKWNSSGYSSIDRYVNSIIDERYIDNATKRTSANIPFWQNLCPPFPQPQRDMEMVRIGYIKGDLHHLPLFVALGEGFLENAGISPVLQSFDNGPDMMVQGFKMGTVDIGYLGIAPVLIYSINANDGDLEIDVVSQVNSEGSAIVIRKGVDKIRTLATPGPGSVQYFLALRAKDEL
jgi:NitT/TauT family transport system substrate-binding protein